MHIQMFIHKSSQLTKCYNDLMVSKRFRYPLRDQSGFCEYELICMRHHR